MASEPIFGSLNNVQDVAHNLIQVNHTQRADYAHYSCPQPIVYNRERFALVVVFAVPVAILGVFLNVFLFFILLRSILRKGSSASTPTINEKGEKCTYLCVLALFDVVLCMCYILLMGCDAIALFFQIEWLWKAWHQMCLQLFMISRFTQLIQAYILVCATIERLIFTVPGLSERQERFDSNMFRLKCSSSVIVCCVCFRAVAYFALYIHQAEHCEETPFSYLEVQPTDFGMSNAYFIYEQMVVPILQTGLPCVILLPCNIWILIFLCRSRTESEIKRTEHRQRLCQKLQNEHIITSFSTKETEQETRLLPKRSSLPEPSIHRTKTKVRNTALSFDIDDRFVSFAPKHIEECRELWTNNKLHSSSTVLDSGSSAAVHCVLPLVSTAQVLKTALQFLGERHREQVILRRATVTSLTLVTAFLICNSFSLFIFILEQFPENSLLFQMGRFNILEPTVLYTISSDVISVLFLLNSTCRPLLYLVTNGGCK